MVKTQRQFWKQQEEGDLSSTQNSHKITRRFLSKNITGGLDAIFKVLKEKINLSTKNTTSEKTGLQNEGEIETFPGKQNWIITNSTLKIAKGSSLSWNKGQPESNMKTYENIKLFGKGKHANFRQIQIQIQNLVIQACMCINNFKLRHRI